MRVSSAPRAASLLEVVVVLLIAAGVCLLLLPLLNRSREHARERFCTNNLRHLDQAMTGYMGYRYGKSPPTRISDNMETRPFPELEKWPLTLLADLDPEANEKITKNRLRIRRPVCYTCPSHPLAIAGDDDEQPCLYTLVVENRGEWRRIGVEDPRWKWEGSWRRRDGLYWTETPNDEVTLEFEGVGIDVTGLVSDLGGLADVYLDGERQAWHLDAYSDQTDASPDDVLWSSLALGSSPDKHTLRIKLLQFSDPHSAGRQIEISGVIVYRKRVEDVNEIHWAFRDREANLAGRPAEIPFRSDEDSPAENRSLWRYGPRITYPQAAWQLRHQAGPHSRGAYQQSFGSTLLQADPDSEQATLPDANE